LEKADAEISFLESRKLMFFGHVIWKPGNCLEKICRLRYQARRKTTHNLARQHQGMDMDRVVVGGSSEGSRGLFRMEEECPQCSPTMSHWGGLENGKEQYYFVDQWTVPVLTASVAVSGMCMTCARFSNS